MGGVDWGEVSIEDISQAILKAIDLGINFFDTAAVYGLGLSESRLSEILGSKRHDLYIATKGGLSWSVSNKLSNRAQILRDSSPKNLRQGVEESLRRLRISRIPIYYVHWPDPNVEIHASFELLNKLLDEGKIDKIGCSNFNLAQITEASKITQISFIQLPLNLLNNQISNELNIFLESKQIKIVAYNALASGLLTGKYNQASIFNENDRRSRLPLFQGENYTKALTKVQEINKLADLQGMSSSQYSIAKILKLPNIASVIVGIKNTKQLEENWEALEKLNVV